MHHQQQSIKELLSTMLILLLYIISIISLYFESTSGSLVFFYGPEVTLTRVTTSGVLVEASEDDGEEVWLTT